MRLLLDTHILLWALEDGTRLTAEMRRQLQDRANDVLFSAASVWEIAIKTMLGRADFGVQPQEIVEAARETGFMELPVSAAAAARVSELPQFHRDPFDRLLIAQAITEPARLYTADRLLRRYSELVTVMA
ncbi:MAG: type II toxin-antitoxin system VapC family toxin [Acetobacteraceae bacterium]|nr:type II toxin-antitoxin system VapC family toxin [Acetobacteraceae bacterium]